MSDLASLSTELRSFAQERGWLRHHTPRNLAMAVASEAGELLAEFRWLTADEADPGRLSPDSLAKIESEMADVLIFLVRLADVLDVDLAAAVRAKQRFNETRFPIK